jgi:ATP-dependent Clp protease ATP-binding subunit ClpB
MAAEQTIHLDRYAPEAKALVAGAQSLADERRHAQVEPIHLLARAIERDRGVQEVFRRAGAEPADVTVEAESALARVPKATGGLAYLSSAMLQLLSRAEKEAVGGPVDVEPLLNALSQEIRGPAAVVLQAFGLGPGSFRPHMAALKAVPREVAPASASGSGDALARFTHDLIGRARRGDFDPVIGRDTEVRRLLQVLERRQKNHPLLVGEAGIGKTAIVRALATRIAAGDVPESIAKLQLLELETGLLVAGAKLRGEIEERLRQVIAAASAASAGKEAVLYVSGIDSLLGQGVAGSGIGDLLKPVLARGEVRILASTTIDGARKLHERDPGLLRRFSVLAIEPPTVDQAIEVLRGVASRYEAHHEVRVGEGAIVATVRLAKRYLQDRALPDAAIDLLDETAARKRVEIDGVPPDVDVAIRRLASLEAQAASLAGDTDAMSVKTRSRIEDEMRTLQPAVGDMRAKLEAGRKAPKAVDDASNLVTAEDVAQVLGDWTGIPVSKMLEAESDKLLKMEPRLAERVVGQGDAVRAVSRAVRRGRVGLRDPGKPIGSFLFLGPSGVGKTELAKALAEFLFDDEQALTRMDMSEYMERHMAQRLIGAPPGYADSEQGGMLTEAARRKPYSVLLFDEVEKAHADVFNMLLQVLDDGRLTDGRGRLADFSNTVVIMTSNIGSKRILETDVKLWASEEGREAIRDVLLEELKAFFRPEFLNRIDDVVVFKALTKEDLRSVVDIQLRRLERLLSDREIKLDLTSSAKGRLVELGYEPSLGARPLKRAILRELQNPLAEALLAGGYTGGQTVHVDVADDKFTFKV